ncbi:polysaccharide lyase [Novipirellula sp. SH528]|uniref:polysaccharide lyase n=1 Tax=Novipirellula sp. SH528 TaxID=3454466 RepID=UPI003FA013AF
MKLVLFTLCLIAVEASAYAQTSLLTVADFETNDLSQLGTQQAQGDSLSVVTSPVRAGKYAVRTLLRASDPKVHRGQRAEFTDDRRRTKIEMEKDYWYGLSVFIPGDFAAPTKTDAVIFQWHTQQGGPSPVLAIRVQSGEWKITSDATEKRRTLAKLPFEKGRWTDWVVHARWSAEAKGFWTIWKDGIEVVNESGIITQYPEALGPYAKFGQYHSVDEVPQNIVYFDEYRVAGPNGSYDVVAPPGTRVPQNP